MNEKNLNQKFRLRIAPDPILRKVSKKVDKLDENLFALIDALKKSININEKGVSTVGMSGVQLGVLKRVCVCYNPKTGKTYTLINPETTSQSKKKSGFWEACASVGVGENQLFAKVYRPDKITVKYQNEKGVQIKKKVSGFFAHVILHEIDHMNGILFIDHVEPNKIWKNKDLEAYIQAHGKYPPS